MALLEMPLRLPKLTATTFAVLGLAGAVLLFFAPRQEDPDFAYRWAHVVVPYPGADTASVERLVTKPLEEHIASLRTLQALDSESRPGVAVIKVQLRAGEDYDRSFERLREKVGEATPFLPIGVRPIVKDRLAETYAMLIAVVGRAGRDISPLEVRHHAEEVEKELERIDAVERADVLGAPPDDIEAQIEVERLSKWGVDPQRIDDALRARNLEMPAGRTRQGDRELPVEVRGDAESLREIADTIVDVGAEGEAVRLRDVASVTRGGRPPDELFRLGGRRAVFVGPVLRSGGDIAEMTTEARERLEQLRQRLPRDIELVEVFDQSISVEARFAGLVSSIWQGMLLVVVVLSLFLGLRQAIVAALAIPLSVVLSGVVLKLTGTPISQTSVIGFIIALGMLVDNAIVMVENITDHVREGKVGPLEATVAAAGEIQAALASSTLTTVVAFVPLLFMSGDPGAYVFDLPLTVVVTLMASLVVALFFTPLSSYALFAKRMADAPKASLKAENITGPLRRPIAAFAHACAVVRRRDGLLTIGVIGLTVAAAFCAPILGFQMFPKGERPLLLVRVELPAGAPISATDAALRKLAEAAERVPETSYVASFAGRSVPRFYYNLEHEYAAPDLGYLLWTGREGDVVGRPVGEIARELRRLLPGIAPEAKVSVRELQQGPPVVAPVIVEIRGDDLATLRTLAAAYRDRLAAIPGVVEARDSYGADGFALEVALDLEKANRLGLTRADVTRTLSVLLGGSPSTTIEEAGEDRVVVLRLPESDRARLETLERLHVRSPLIGTQVPLRQVATIRPDVSLSRIERHNRARRIQVHAWIEGRVASHVMAEATAATADIELPQGYEARFRGDDEEMRESSISVAKAGLFAILAIFLILVAEFDSLVQPLVILAVVPPALAAAIFGLLLTGYPIGFMALIGVASLSGIVVNDAIVLLEFANSARAKGRSIEEAVEEAAERRVSPILSTSLTTIGGLLPLAMTGGALWAPLCYVIIFGLTASTVGTLTFLPFVYRVADRIAVALVPPRKKGRVLVIDDDRDVLETVEEVLSDRFEVLTTTDAKRALDVVHSFQPDAVVVDYMMPGRDGLDIIGALRGSLPELTILMLTAHAGSRVKGSPLTTDLGAEAVLRGADAFVRKTELDGLAHVVADALRRPRASLAGRLLSGLRRRVAGATT